MILRFDQIIRIYH